MISRLTGLSTAAIVALALSACSQEEAPRPAKPAVPAKPASPLAAASPAPAADPLPGSGTSAQPDVESPAADVPFWRVTSRSAVSPASQRPSLLPEGVSFTTTSPT